MVELFFSFTERKLERGTLLLRNVQWEDFVEGDVEKFPGSVSEPFVFIILSGSQSTKGEASSGAEK